MKRMVVVGALFAACVGLVVVIFALAGEVGPVTTASTGPSTAAHATAHDEAATRGGDAAPHQGENRGHLQPKHLTEAERQALDAEGRELLPTLERVRAAGTITPDAVTAALVAAGYAPEHVAAVPRALPSDGVTEYTVFGIEVGDACVSGFVSPTEVQALGMGRVREWGCVPPDTH